MLPCAALEEENGAVEVLESFEMCCEGCVCRCGPGVVGDGELRGQERGVEQGSLCSDLGCC